ncbi:SAF domain-containing protein [Lentzea sp. E54]|uniref:SAF domain-containing protein n=1 Tax=Lentzea xerophila TaxID=3435883 RepID=UPI003DA1D313
MTTNITPQDRAGTPVGGPWVTNGKPASRLRGMKRRRSIPHLLLGAVLVIACAAASLVMSLNSGHRDSVLALARPVPVGQTLTMQDLKHVSIAVDPGVSVVDTSQAASVVGKTMSASLPAGALLTPEAVSGAGIPEAGQAIAALSLKAGQFPPEVSPGSHVSVVFVPGQLGATQTGPPAPEATPGWRAVVTSVTAPANQQTTVVSVQLNPASARQIAAVPAGQLAIVMLAGSGR